MARTKVASSIQCHLQEAVCGSSALRVDRDKGVIFGVKVLGRSSPNKHGLKNVEGTDYTDEAIRSARPLYEGLKVNCDHPPRETPGKDRSAYDRLGRLENVRIESGELFADLKLLRSHPMADRLMEAAETMPDAFGLSHNAYGRGTIEHGRYVIHEILNARSVDVVADAGTTRSLFESDEDPMAKKTKTTLRALIESSKVADTIQDQLLEMDDATLDAEMPAPAGDWKQHLVAAVGQLVSSEDEADHKLAKKIMDMLKPGSADEPKPKETPESDESDSKKDKDKDAMESLRRELDELKADKHVRELCESMAFSPTKAQLKAIRALGSDVDRKELVKELKESKESPAKKAAGPRSTPAGARNLQEAREVKDGKSFAEAISLRR